MSQHKRNYAMSKRRRRFIAIICLLFTALLIFLDNFYFRHNLYHGRASAAQTENPDFDKYNSGIFTVINVLDGDTLDINFPDNQSKYTRIRLLGIDAPEIHSESGQTYYGSQSRNFVNKLMQNKNVTIYLDDKNNTRGKYGRLLAYVMLPDGKLLNEELLSNGFAYADTRFRHSFYNKYKQLESSARANKKGLWQNVTPEQMPEWVH